MTDLQLIFAAVVGTLAVARITRLIVDDDWPPIAWARRKWWDWWLPMNESTAQPDQPRTKNAAAWVELVTCSFCVGVWVAFVGTLLTWLSFNGDGKLDAWWWLPSIFLASSYAAGMIVVRDIPQDERTREQADD